MLREDRPPGLKFSSEIETNDIFKRDSNFKRATHQTPIFVGIPKVEIENFKRD